MIKRNPSLKRSKEWFRIQEYGTYAGYKILLCIYQLTGIVVLRIILYPVVAFYFLLNINARKSSKEYLQKIHQFMGDKSPWRSKPGLWISFQQFMSFGHSTVDKVTVWLGSYQNKDLIFSGNDAFSCLKKAGKGVILIVSHLGNVEVCRAISGESKGDPGPTTILMHNAHAPHFQRILSEVTGTKENIEIIEVENFTPDVAIKLQRKIELGETIVIAGDRMPVDSKSRYEVCSFLGKDASFGQGPFIMASLLDCPVFLLFGMKQESKYHVFFEQFSDSLKITKKERTEYLKENVKKYVTRLEYYACSYPLQWYNFYNFWSLPQLDEEDH